MSGQLVVRQVQEVEVRDVLDLGRDFSCQTVPAEVERAQLFAI